MKQQPDANATIQLDRALDQLDGIHLDELDAASASSASSPPHARARLTPPPLPPSFAPSAPPAAPHSGSPIAPGSPSIAPRFESAPSGRSAGKTTALAGLFIALLAVAIVGGWKVAVALRPAPPAATPAPIVEAVPAATPLAADPAAASASPAPGAPAPAVLTIPTIEMNDTPSEAQDKK